MKKAFRKFPLLLALAALPPALFAQNDPGGSPRPVRVLWVGASYLVPMPQPATEMINSCQKEIRVETVNECRGGVSLKTFIEERGIIEKIEAGKYDIVVINSISLRTGPVAERQTVDVVAQAAVKSGAKVMFYASWIAEMFMQEQPDEFEKLNGLYAGFAEKYSGTFIPAGYAWEKVMREHPEIDLFAQDRSHAGPPGIYLTCCLLYSVFTDKNPADIPDSVSYSEDGKRKELGVDQKTGAILRQAAWDVYSAMKNKPALREKTEFI